MEVGGLLITYKLTTYKLITDKLITDKLITKIYKLITYKSVFRIRIRTNPHKDMPPGSGSAQIPIKICLLDPDQYGSP